MPKLRDTVISERDFAARTYAVPTYSLASWATLIKVDIARCTTATPNVWPDRDRSIAFSFDLSLDDGVTWFLLFSGESWGGIDVHSKTGEEIPYTNFVMPLPTAQKRKIRGTVEVKGGSIRTSVIVDVQG